MKSITRIQRGCVGICNNSIVGSIDGFLVYGPDGFGLSVEAKEKLTTMGEDQVSTVLMLRFHANKEWIRLFVF